MDCAATIKLRALSPQIVARLALMASGMSENDRFRTG